MNTIADTLGTTYFQLSTVGVGALAVGVADIRQRIFNVLQTIPGTDPLRPLFGSNAYQWNDKPLSTSIPNTKKSIFDALGLWMPEIQVTSIIHTIIDAGHVAYDITYALIDSELTDTITWSSGVLSGTTVVNSIIITANVPVKVTNGIYRVVFTVNGSSANPLPPAEGFTSSADMLTWINANWANYGRWYLTSNTLILYLNSGIANTASLTVTETAEITITELIPILSAGQFFNLDFTINGAPPSIAFPTGTFSDVGNMLTWILDNWSIYGDWFVKSDTTTGTGSSIADFNTDFNSDFGMGNSLVTNYYLTFQSSAYTAATLNFT